MQLPKLKLQRKLFNFFLLVSILPLVLFTVVWIHFFQTKVSQIIPNTLLLDSQIVLFTITLFFVVTVYLVFLSIWLSRQIGKPIELLQKGAHMIGAGNLNYRLHIRTGDEIEDLGNSFNAMVGKLQEAFQKIEEDKSLISAERNKLEVALSGIADAVVAVDTDRNVILFNKAAEKLTGFSSRDALEKPIAELFNLFDGEVKLSPTEYCPIKTNSFEGIVFSRKDLKVVSKKKEAFVNLIVGKIREGGVVNLGCILAFHDITQEKQLETMKLDFVSMAAHELRTPLTTLKGYLSVFTSENSQALDKEQNMFLARMNIAAAQLSTLIENLLSVARIERGKLNINLELVDLREITLDTINELRNRAEERKLTLTFSEPAKPLPKIHIDKIRIQEVLSNLLSNAISYTQPGGKVNVSFEQDGNNATVHIQDTGQGIPKEALPHLFTKFFRVSGALESGSKGTGLGLYISKAIIIMHHGKIWVESEFNKGSTFSFSLPIDRV